MDTRASQNEGGAGLQGEAVGDDPVIEALRGFAAVMVMATHYTYMVTAAPGTWAVASTGVNLFFVLSGFVFAPYLCGKRLAVIPHLIRRFFRLYPLYLVALFVYAGLRQPASTAWSHFGSHAAMAHTLVSIEVASFYNSAFWSLPPEVEYYLALPLLAWGAARFGLTPLLAVAAGMHLLLVAFARPDEGVTARALATIHLPGLMVQFLLGSMAYLMVRQAPGMRARCHRLLIGLSIFIVVTTLFAKYVVQPPGTSAVPPVWIGGNIGVGAALAYAFIVSAVAGSLQARQRRTAVRWTALFIILGQLSYGVYLFHNAAPQMLGRVAPGVKGVVAVALSVGITVLMALAVHHIIERPFRDFGRKFSRRFAG